MLEILRNLQRQHRRVVHVVALSPYSLFAMLFVFLQHLPFYRFPHVPDMPVQFPRPEGTPNDHLVGFRLAEQLLRRSSRESLNDALLIMLKLKLKFYPCPLLFSNQRMIKLIIAFP